MADFVDPLGAIDILSGGGNSSLSSTSLLSSPGFSSPLLPSSLPSDAATKKPAVAASTAHSGAGTVLKSSEVVIDPLAGSMSPAMAVSSAVSTRVCPFLDWPVRKSAILREYTVTGNIAVSASFMAEGVDDSEEQGSLPLAKARLRLEALEAAAMGVASVEMTQGEYVKRIEKLHRALEGAWNTHHRVAALKITIQCAKVLGEHRVPQFYPSMFVMVTDILDTFGRLVFDRLKALADEEYRKLGNKTPLPDNFIAGDVGGEARETCRNWLYKTSCIRELLPRLYLEMALLASYRFLFDLTEADIAAILLRLAHGIRGIGNPVVAAYARLYLARMAAKLVRDDNKQRESMFVCIADFMTSFNDITSPSRVAVLEAQGLSLPVYLHLFQPALAWQMHQLGWGANKDTFQAVLQLYKDNCNSSMVLQLIIESFDPYFYSPYTETMMDLIESAKPSLSTPADLYRALASQLVKNPPPATQRLSFLREAHKAITKVAEPIQYSKNAAALMDLLLVAYSEREVLLLLGDVVKRIQANAVSKTGESSRRGGRAVLSAPVASLPFLEKILTGLVEYEVSRANKAAAGEAASRFSGVLTSEHFTSLLDMFDSEHKPALAKSLLSALTAVPGSIMDPVVVNTMLEVARTCHDSLDVLSSEDEHRTMSTLICEFIGNIDLGRDLERQLELYVDCRQSFPNLDPVKDRLVACAVDLSWRALKFVKGRHTAKTASFVKSVLAFVAITIPDIDNPFRRMSLYQAAGIAALNNNCVAQGDMLLRGVVQEIPELGTSLAVSSALAATGARTGATFSTATDMKLLEFLKEYAAAIVPAPGHPEQGPFYLARGLLNAIQKYPWQGGAQSTLRFRALMLLLTYAHAMSMDPLPNRIPGLESNDVLYAGDPDYAPQLIVLQRTVIEAMVATMLELDAAAHEAKEGKAGGDGRAKAVLLEVLPEWLTTHTAGIIDLDVGAIPALEKVCLCLQSLAPEHPAVKTTIGEVQRRTRK